MSGYEARILNDGSSFARNVVRLAIRRDRGGAHEYLKDDGGWIQVDDGVQLPDRGYGIELPAESIEAIAVAIAEYQGHTSHADTEARVLREWLAAERARVDSALLSMLRDISPVAD